LSNILKPAGGSDGDESLLGFKCPICMESVDEKSVWQATVCGHQFCRDCIVMHLQSQVDNGGNGRCPSSNECNTILTDEEIKAVITPELFAKFVKFRALRSDPLLRECPRCQKLNRKMDQDIVQIVCAQCGLVYCYLHGNIHEGKNCEEFMATRSDYDKHVSQLSEQLIQSIAKPCPKCAAMVVRGDGCDHVKCSQCGTDYCYKCQNINMTGKFLLKCTMCQNSFIEHEYFCYWRIMAVLCLPIWLPLAFLWSALFFGLFLLSCCCCLPCAICGDPSFLANAAKGSFTSIFLPFIMVSMFAGLSGCECLQPTGMGAHGPGGVPGGYPGVGGPPGAGIRRV